MSNNPTIQAQEIQNLRDEEQMKYLVTTYEVEEVPSITDEEIKELFTSSFPEYQRLIVIHDKGKINVHAHIKKFSYLDLDDLKELGFEFRTLTSRPDTEYVNSFEKKLTSYVTIKFVFTNS